MMDKVKKKTVSVHVSRAVFYLCNFLTFEDGTGRLSQNVHKELPLCAV